jgi:hypothetical protein
VRFTIPNVCSPQIAAVNRDDVKYVFSVHIVVWAINNVALYRVLTVIYFNNFFNFPIEIFLFLKSLGRQNSLTLRPPIY